MTGTVIGVFAFGTSPTELMTAERTRALLAEAALQGADLIFFSAADCDLDSGLIKAARWTRSGWETVSTELPGLVNVITSPITERQRETDAWLRQGARVIAFHRHDKLKVAALLQASPWAGCVIPHARLKPEALREELTEWLRAGPTVVKPIDGMRGTGIHFAIPDGGAWALTRGDQRWTGTLSDTVAQIETNIRGRMRYRDYMAQRFIDSQTPPDAQLRYASISRACRRADGTSSASWAGSPEPAR